MYAAAMLLLCCSYAADSADAMYAAAMLLHSMLCMLMHSMLCMLLLCCCYADA